MNPQKINLLPEVLRQKLNRRLHAGKEPARVAKWLNRVPAARAALKDALGGCRVLEADVAAWKEDGHRLWLAQQGILAEVRRVSGDAREFSRVDRRPLTDSLAAWAAGRYAAATRELEAASAEDGFNWAMLRAFCHDLVLLRRGDHESQWLRLEGKRLKLEKARQRDRMERLFLKWAKENPEKLRTEPELTPEEKQIRMRQIFGLS